MKWFDVNKEGLGKILASRGPEFIGRELVQNALDENTSEVDVRVEWADGETHLTVTDDSPEGFHDLTHAWTLFAESKKKADPTKRGRFNLGEKLVLALCSTAQITTTTGRVVFDAKGRRQQKTSTKAGSIFEGWIPQTKAEADAMRAGICAIIPPTNIKVRVDGTLLKRPKDVRQIKVRGLETEMAGADGVLKRTRRNATLRLYEPRPGEKAMLHEMGIPVVELEGGDRWHVDVEQKVPLTLDRDNVSPAYLRRIRTEVINATADLLTVDDANSGWAREALKDPKVSTAAVNSMLTLRFGEKRVALDPSDPEANQLAASKGYTVISGRMLAKEEWANVKRAEALLPAGKVTPSPKVGDTTAYDEAKWTPAMRWVVEQTERVASALIGMSVTVRITNDDNNVLAHFGARTLCYNVRRLGKGWFDRQMAEGPHAVALNRLIIHEVGHHYSSNHLSEEYHDALCQLGAKLAVLVAEQPELFVRATKVAARKA